VLTQAEEREDGQNHDDLADKINQFIHAPLLVQWRSEHKTAHKEESSGTAETIETVRPGSLLDPDNGGTWRAPDSNAKSATSPKAHIEWVTAPLNEPGAGAGPGAGPGLVSTAIPGAEAGPSAAAFS
jgi:hypothetical protein